MKKEERNKGVTLATLVITIVVLLILSGITINYGVSNIKRAKIQNIKTNMLLIEAKTKEYVENANYDLGIKPNEATAEMKEKAISELEGEGKGTKVNMEMYRFWYSKYFESVKMELEQKENKILGIKVK